MEVGLHGRWSSLLEFAFWWGEQHAARTGGGAEFGGFCEVWRGVSLWATMVEDPRCATGCGATDGHGAFGLDGIIVGKEADGMMNPFTVR